MMRHLSQKSLTIMHLFAVKILASIQSNFCCVRMALNLVQNMQCYAKLNHYRKYLLAIQLHVVFISNFANLCKFTYNDIHVFTTNTL
jgi:hypothetical protein